MISPPIHHTGSKLEIYDKHPCVQIEFGHRNGKRQLVWASIDTGADHVYANPNLLIQCGCPVVGFVPINAFGNAKEDQAGVYEAGMTFAGLPSPIEVKAVGVNTHSIGDGFQVVLGRIFLQLCRLDYAPHGESVLHYMAA